MHARLGSRIAWIVLASAAYVLGCHWLMTRAHETPWNAVGVLCPMLLVVAWGAWRAGQRRWAGVAAAAVAALCAQALWGVQIPAPALYLAQHVGVNACLAIAFGSTLRRGHVALITTLARRVHRHFTPAMTVYTRQVTLAWTLFFVAMCIVSLALYASVPFAGWALFANLGTPLAVAAMFGAEFTVRYRLHPEFERTTVADAVRAYLHSDAQTAGAAARDKPA